MGFTPLFCAFENELIISPRYDYGFGLSKSSYRRLSANGTHLCSSNCACGSIIRYNGISIVHGLEYVSGSSSVASYRMWFGPRSVNRSVTFNLLLKWFPARSSHRSPIWLVVMTTSTSPSHFPLDFPIHESAGRSRWSFMAMTLCIAANG